MYGVPRATQDVDMVAVVAPADAAWFAREFTRALADEFYADEDAIRDAVRAAGSFNVIHLPTMFKADVFLSRLDVWGRNQIARSRIQQIEVDGGVVAIRVASPEDTILHKLYWYRLGHETSERQWGDVLGVLRIQGATLDAEYLERYAAELGVSDLLSRARELA